MWRRLAHPVYLAITYLLVKLIFAVLKKAANNLVESRYLKKRDVVEVGMVVVRLSYRLDYSLPYSGKSQIAAPERSSL